MANESTLGCADVQGATSRTPDAEDEVRGHASEPVIWNTGWH